MGLGLLLMYLLSGDKELSFLSSNLSIWSRVRLCRLSFPLDAMAAIYSDPACGFFTLSTEPSSASYSVAIRPCKNDCVNRIPENMALRRTLTKMTTALFRLIQSNIKDFCRYQSSIIYRYSPHEKTD